MPRRQLNDEEAVFRVLSANLGKPLSAPEIAKELGWGDDAARVANVIVDLKEGVRVTHGENGKALVEIILPDD
jgi:hypothetical protein